MSILTSRNYLEHHMLDLVNEERCTQLGAAHSLGWDERIASIARAHSVDMLTRGYFGHISPEGLEIGERLRRCHLEYVLAGENIGWIEARDISPQEQIRQLHSGLMKSPEHRDNILNRSFSNSGIGLARSREPRLVVTQVFITAGNAIQSGFGAVLTKNIPHSRRIASVLPLYSPNPLRAIVHSKRNSLEVFVAAQEAQVRRTWWQMDGRVQKHILAFPATVYLIGFAGTYFSKLYVFYAKHLPRFLSDLLHKVNLPNIYSDHSVCIAKQDECLLQLAHELSNRPVQQQLAFIVDYFWASVFNTDLAGTYFVPFAEYDRRFVDPETWAMHTRRNREFVLSVDWFRACTLGEAIQQFFTKW